MMILSKLQLTFINVYENGLYYEINMDIHISLCVFVKCNAVYRAVCDLEWYKLESRKARNLIILMIRIHEPFRITAGKIVPLTMTTFCSVRSFLIYVSPAAFLKIFKNSFILDFLAEKILSNY